MFKVILHNKAAKNLRDLPSRARGRIIACLKEMEVDPFTGDIKPVKPLSGMFRRRVGDYRIIFTVDFERSAVVALIISPRERAYESL